MGKKIYIENTPIDTGDYLIADEDGIVIIPKNIVRKIINKAKNDLNSEDKMRIAILNGENPKKAYLKYKNSSFRRNKLNNDLIDEQTGFTMPSAKEFDIKKLFSLEERTTLITGAAQGIGRVAAIACGKAGR